MDKFLEIVGIVIVLLTLLVAVVITANSGNANTLFYILPWAVPSVIGGVVLAAFGSMLEQLKAIRAATEFQADRIRAAELRSVTPTKSELPSHMKTCPQCKNAVRSDANVCSYCGTSQW